MKSILLLTVAAVFLSLAMSAPAPAPAPAAKQDNVELIGNNTLSPATDLRFVSREEWGARAPTSSSPLATPVPHVILHHTYVPGACATFEQCAAAMRSMQRFHMDDHAWADIGYNWCVGGDGAVYEGRGWGTHGAHAGPLVNGFSQGICLIGDWTVELPPKVQLDAARELIRRGTALGYIRTEYTLMGHRQVRHTECPGDALFAEVSTWEHYSPHPATPDEPLSSAADAPPLLH